MRIRNLVVAAVLATAAGLWISVLVLAARYAMAQFVCHCRCLYANIECSYLYLLLSQLKLLMFELVDFVLVHRLYQAHECVLG